MNWSNRSANWNDSFVVENVSANICKQLESANNPNIRQSFWKLSNQQIENYLIGMLVMYAVHTQN